MSAAAASAFNGRCVLVVEDESIVSFMLEDMLTELGFSDVCLAGSVEEGLARLEVGRPDVAVLDVNLAGEQVFPVAERLEKMGIPFVFATGYGRKGIPQRWQPTITLQKPFSLDALAAALETSSRGKTI